VGTKTAVGVLERVKTGAPDANYRRANEWGEVFIQCRGLPGKMYGLGKGGTHKGAVKIRGRAGRKPTTGREKVLVGISIPGIGLKRPDTEGSDFRNRDNCAEEEHKTMLGEERYASWEGE